MTMKRIIDFLNILALCAAFGLLASCGEKSGLDPDPEPEPEPEPVDWMATSLS